MLRKFPFKNSYEKLFYSLTGKLLFAIGSLIIVGSVIFWYLLIKYQEKELVDNAVKYGVSFVDFVGKSTRYGMLTFHQNLIQENLEAMSSAEGVISIRIFNKNGRVTYASSKKDIGISENKNAPACLVCHHNRENPAEKVHFENQWTITEGTEDFRILNIVQPIYNEPACYSASCHVHLKSQKVLGVIESKLSLALMDKAVRKQKLAITAYVIGFIFIISLVLCNIIWRLVSKPVTTLVEGMEKVGSGDLEYSAKINTRDEMGILAEAFNAMTMDLKEAREIMVNWTKALEEEVRKKTREIRQAQSQLIHAEKLASLGRMAAGFAHEINNPMTGIITFAHSIMKRLPPESPDREDLEIIIDQAERCSKTIKGLLGFARATEMVKSPTNINEVLKVCVMMVSGKTDFKEINFNLNLDDDIPQVTADISQLQQVFLNMLVNAADAMEGKGIITVASRKANEDDKPYVEIEFTDTGPGILKEYMGKIFEPFFSTKPVGKGTGLGLSVSHGIIQDHKGKINVRSEPGHGASFFIRLPV